MACLVSAIALYQLVVEVKVIVPTFNLRPLYLVLLSLGVLFPVVAVLARPKQLVLPAVLFVFILLSTPKHVGGGWGTMSNTWSSTTYGWPSDYITVYYHKGGNWSPDNSKWIPYEERSIGISWWKTLIVLATSVAGTCILLAPRKLIEMRRANKALHATSEPAPGAASSSHEG
jgi:hypothetical protein